jgi:hypothetical protein
MHSEIGVHGINAIFCIGRFLPVIKFIFIISVDTASVNSLSLISGTLPAWPGKQLREE